MKIDGLLGKISEAQIRDLEKIINCTLPTNYRNFLLENNGCRIFPDTFKTIDNSFESSIRYLFGIDANSRIDILRNIKDYYEILPKGFLPIGNDSLGNLICLKLDKYDNSVHFWDHESEYYNEEVEKSMYRIANNFQDFVANLYEVELEKNEIDIAISTQNIEHFRRLTSKGVDIHHIENSFSQPVPVVASLNNKLKVLEYFVNNGYPIKGLLILACKNGHENIVKYLLKKGADPNERESTSNFDTCLIKSASFGHIHIIKILLSYGADISLKNRVGHTAEYKASLLNKVQVVKYLNSKF